MFLQPILYVDFLFSCGHYLRFLNFDENSLRPILSFLDPARCSNHDGVFFYRSKTNTRIYFIHINQCAERSTSPFEIFPLPVFRRQAKSNQLERSLAPPGQR